MSRVYVPPPPNTIGQPPSSPGKGAQGAGQGQTPGNDKKKKGPSTAKWLMITIGIIVLLTLWQSIMGGNKYVTPTDEEVGDGSNPPRSYSTIAIIGAIAIDIIAIAFTVMNTIKLGKPEVKKKVEERQSQKKYNKLERERERQRKREEAKERGEGGEVKRG